MKSICRIFLISLATICSDSFVTAAQDVHIVSSFPPQTPADVLRSKGIADQSEPSLVAALTNSDPEIRNLAANTLAQYHLAEAAPAIESALSREQDPSAQIGLSEALWSLHDDKGEAHLHIMCTDSSLKFMTLVSIIDALKLTHLPTAVCTETFFAAFTRAKEPGEIAMGTTRLAALYRDATRDQQLRIITTLRLLLADKKQEPSVRLESSQALSEIGTPECAEAIRTAIAQEPNPDFRTFFEATLKGLEKNPH